MMLCLTRKRGESVIIDGNIEVKINEIKTLQVRLCFDAPKDIKILRKELEQIPCSRDKLKDLLRDCLPYVPEFRREKILEILE